MNIDKLFNELNEDLSREYSHWHFYMSAASNIEGLHRQELSEFLLEQAKGEMQHILQFKNLLNALIIKRNLNKTVCTKVADYKNNLKCPKDILIEALRMEDQVVKNYAQRIEDASNLQNNEDENDKVDGKYIELFLEDQLTDSRNDADQIRMMIK
jgi:ferritin